jgi:hypothetical protein
MKRDFSLLLLKTYLNNTHTREGELGLVVVDIVELSVLVSVRYWMRLLFHVDVFISILTRNFRPQIP